MSEDQSTEGFQIVGTVVRGDQRGRIIRFPTANIMPATDGPAPPRGVWAAFANDAPAAVNVGLRPTFAAGTEGLLIEVHILDFEGDLYGQTLHLKFVKHLRTERRFETVDELTAQLRRDVQAVRNLLSQPRPS